MCYAPGAPFYISEAIRMMRETDEYSGEGIYMNIAVTDDTEDERRPADE